MGLSIREAVVTDLPKLIKMLADDSLGSTREDFRMPLNPRYQEIFAHISKDGNNELIVAEKDSEIVGMLQLTFIPYLTHIGTWRCQIEGVRVDKDHRGRGIGTELLNWVFTRAIERRCEIVQLTSNKTRHDALRFYKSLGFIPSHEGLKLQLSKL